jgi:hypothetical protein
VQISISEQEVVVDGVRFVLAEESSPLPPGQLSANFNESEFKCKCCGQLPAGKPPQQLVDILQSVRDHFGQPVTINSGYRCPSHNAAVGGATKSQHMDGIAADISVKDVKPSDVYAYIEKLLAGTGGLGKYSTFTHVDVRTKGPARWVG